MFWTKLFVILVNNTFQKKLHSRMDNQKSMTQELSYIFLTNVNIEISLITRIFKYVSKLFIHFIIVINRKCFKSWRRHLTSNGIEINHYSCFIEWNQLRFEYKKKKKKKTRNNIVFIRKNSSLCLASLTYEFKINGYSDFESVTAQS